MITNDCSVLLYALMQMHMLLKILKENPKRNKVLKMQHFVKKKKIISSIVGPLYPETYKKETSEYNFVWKASHKSYNDDTLLLIFLFYNANLTLGSEDETVLFIALFEIYASSIHSFHRCPFILLSICLGMGYCMIAKYLSLYTFPTKCFICDA